MAEHFRMPKGRQTIRKSGGRRTRLWELTGSNNQTVQRLEEAYLSGLAAMDRAEARHAANKADPRFTPDGVRDDLLKFVLADAVPVLHRGRTVIRKAKAEVAERRAKLKIEGPDKTDLAAAIRRLQIRTDLQQMKPEAQTQYFANRGNLLPTEVAQAILEMPVEHSGVPNSRHELLTKTALDTRHGPEIAEIVELEEAIAAAESAVETGRDEVRLEAGVFDERKFNELAAPIEKKSDAPWLKKRKTSSGDEETIVVDLEKRVEMGCGTER